MRAIITGGAGFIASHVIPNMLTSTNKYDVLVVDNFSTGKIENISPLLDKFGGKLSLCEGDITDMTFLLRTFMDFNPQKVIHLAAQSAITTSWNNPVHDNKVNVIGTLNVIKASQKVGVDKIVFSSTSAVYKDISGRLNENSEREPNNPYGISKLAAELYLQSMFPNSNILRLGNVYGERQVPIGENQVIPRMIRHFKHGDTFYIHGDGKQKRDFVYAGDVAQAIITSLYGEPGIYNIASGTSFSVNDIAGMMEEIFDVRGYKWDHSKEEDPRRCVKLNISKAKSQLFWKPSIPIRSGLKKVVDWWEQK